MDHKFEESVKQDLQSMDQRLTDMEEKMTSIDTKLTQVVDAILGNPLTKAGGFIDDIQTMKEKISMLEKKQEKYEEFKKRITWTVGIIVSIALILQYVASIYSNVTH